MTYRTILLAVALAWSAHANASAPDRPWRLQYHADEELRARAAIAPDEVDVDGRLFVAWKFAHPDDTLQGELVFDLWSDLDGVPPSSTPTSFAAVRETRGVPVWFDVYALSTAYQQGDLLREARLGRQSVDRGTPMTIDGLSLVSRPLAPYLELFAFGGRSVHFFEVDAGLFEDWVGSVGAAVRPLRDLRLELDYRFHIEDTQSIEGLVNHNYGVSGSYRLGGWLSARVNARGIDAALSRLGGAARVSWPGQDLGAELGVRAQPSELREINELDNPMFSVLGPSQPHLRWRAEVWKGFGTALGHYSLHLGGDGRHLLEASESPFNRDFGRLYAMAQASDVGVRGPYANLVLARHGEYFDFAGHGLWAVSGVLGYQDSAWRAELGSSYDSYKYTYYQSVDEREDVRTVYAEARVKLFRFLSLRARYMFERFAWDVHTVTISVGQTF